MIAMLTLLAHGWMLGLTGDGFLYDTVAMVACAIAEGILEGICLAIIACKKGW